MLGMLSGLFEAECKGPDAPTRAILTLLIRLVYCTNQKQLKP